MLPIEKKKRKIQEKGIGGIVSGERRLVDLGVGERKKGSFSKWKDIMNCFMSEDMMLRD
jgi:hypothetical protein